MTLSEEELEQAKQQLLEQVEKFPDEQREAAQQQIGAMNEEQLEEFLIKNNLIKGGSCIFCSIIDGESFAYKIAESEDAIAVLDINPLSEGQVLILSKMHVPINESKSAIPLSKELSKLLKEKLKADDIKIETNTVQGHGLINVIPIYKGKKLERKKADDKELYELQKKLTIKDAPKERDTSEEEGDEEREDIPVEKLPHAPRRIP
jgi:histidine triad (HIT) family protein